MRFRFQIAGPEQEAALRALLAQESMPGPIRLAYTREPDFFAGLALEGPFAQAFVATQGERVVGMGTRAIRTQFVNGRPQEVGYLGGLRVTPEARRHLGIQRGYKLLKEAHGDGRCPGYLSTILESNPEAKALLLSQRGGLPAYRDLGLLRSHLLLVKHRRAPGGDVRRAGPADLPRVLAFLAEHGPRRQFFPVLDPSLLGTPSLHGLAVEDFWLLERRGELRALMAVWDQRARRQLQVRSYAPWLGLCRPLLNAALRIRGLAPLPPPGREVPLASGAFLRVACEDPGEARALLGGILGALAATELLGVALVFHERDPLESAAAAFPRLSLESRLYGVGWVDSEAWFRSLDPSLVPHVDAAFL